MALPAAAYWEMIHAERARVANMLDGLDAAQWRAASLCTEWTVEQVVAHMTAAAQTGTVGWLRSMAFAGFNSRRHNQRRLRECLGTTPEETGTAFRAAVPLTVAPTKDFPAWLGEVIVHGQDIARPLGIGLSPDGDAVREVATYFAAKDFAVNSRTLVAGLALEATDADFPTGEGPLVRGPLLDLVMAMAGRGACCAELAGDGVSELRRRIAVAR